MAKPQKSKGSEPENVNNALDFSIAESSLLGMSVSLCLSVSVLLLTMFCMLLSNTSTASP